MEVYHALFPILYHKLTTSRRNLGIIFAFTIFFLGTYLVATEYISAQKSKGEVLLFPRGKAKAYLMAQDEESTAEKRPTPAELARQQTRGAGGDVSKIQIQTAIFHWDDVCYDIKIKSETRRLLDHVDGWVKPGTLTALMVCSFLGVRPMQD